MNIRINRIELLENSAITRFHVTPRKHVKPMVIHPDNKAFVDTYIANCPLGCWANEDDIKGPVAFLASEAAGYITGATLVMDGGWTIW